MHRWSTSTYKSLCSSDADIHWMQIEVPRATFKHAFLLHAVMSMSALDIAVSEEGIKIPNADVFVQAAWEYYDLASQSFRAQLDSAIGPDITHSMYICGHILAAVNMALPQCEQSADNGQKPSMIDRMVVFFDLFLGIISVASIDLSWMTNSPATGPLRAATNAILKEGNDVLDNDIEMALERLASLVDGNTSTPGSQDNLRSVSPASDQLQASYQKAMRSVYQCYIEDAKDAVKGFCISFPMFVGYDFVFAFKNHEPIALLITMYWGVLLDRLGKLAWWAKSVGHDLVGEISEVLQRSQLQPTTSSDWEDAIVWARVQVGII
jgi:hypothetical protein